LIYADVNVVWFSVTEGGDDVVRTIRKKLKDKVREQGRDLETIHGQSKHVDINGVKRFRDILKEDEKRLIESASIL
jgi:hypothetical protein